MAPTYKRPNILARWARDVPGSELYKLAGGLGGEPALMEENDFVRVRMVGDL